MTFGSLSLVDRIGARSLEVCMDCVGLHRANLLTSVPQTVPVSCMIVALKSTPGFGMWLLVVYHPWGGSNFTYFLETFLHIRDK